MKIHPFNFRRRYIAYKYRQKEFESVIRKTELYLHKNPNDLFILELRARASASMRDWEQGEFWYRRVFEIDPFYLDCSFQLARCAIYTKNWQILDEVISPIIKIGEVNGIEKALAKKLESLSTQEFIDVVEHKNIVKVLNNQNLQRWTNLPYERRPNSVMYIDHFCLDQYIGGTYLGFVLKFTLSRSVSEVRNIFEGFLNVHSITEIAMWTSPALERFPNELECVSEWIMASVNPIKMPLKALEALCTSEYLSPSLASIVREYLANLKPSLLGEAVRVIGRKTDPRKYLTEEILENMILTGTTVDSSSPIHTWMIEHCLRLHKIDLIQKMFDNNSTGIAQPITNTLRNLVRNRSDRRLVELLEIVLQYDCMLEEIGMRQEIAKSILTVFEPITGFMFAYECIQIEPQDAVCGLYLLQAAIMSGSPKLILHAADITLSMRSRSGKIDYASIAIAAVREDKIDYAKTLLIENRLVSDTRSQRIRIGIPFHIDKDYQKVLDEINNTQGKHINDPTIILYEILTLKKLRKFAEALKCVSEKVKDRAESLLLQHMIYRESSNYEMAKNALDSLMQVQDRANLPTQFFDRNYDFYSLNSKEKVKINKLQPLVTVIMTVHQWNDAFPLAVNSILNQSHTNLELIVVDDCSSNGDVLRYDSILTDNRIKRIRMEKNSGTYTCRNRGIEIAKGEYLTFADSDDWNHPDRISKSIEMIEKKNVDLVMGRFVRVDEHGWIQFNGSKVSQFCLVGVFIRKSALDEYNLLFDRRARYSADSEFFERATVLFGDEKVYRHDGIDIVALHHEHSLTGGGQTIIDWMGPGESRLRYVSGYRKSHAKGKMKKNFEFNDFSGPSFDLISKTPNEFNAKLRTIIGLTEKNIRKKEMVHKSSDDQITVFMATYPGGFHTVKDAIESLLNQTKKIDKLILHVNGNEAPKKLPRDSRLEVKLSKSNDADNGKFKYMSEYEGYFFTVDDDICYPNNYVEKMISYVDAYERKSIIGVHGATFPVGPSITRWSEYRELRRTHVFTNPSATFTQVNCLGTGTIAFHSQIGIPNYENLDTLRMVDLHIAVWAQENSIAMYSCPRNVNWLIEFEVDHETRIWAQANTETQLQAEMIQTLNKVPRWNSLTQFPFELLNGPLTRFKLWKNRQIPIGMDLPIQREWEDLRDNPKVTIYIPAYNTERYIVDCVNSALNQTYPNIEVSIQNGGDGDNTYQKLMDNFSGIPNVIISSELSSLGEGTNIAIGQGTGELILQLDSDDILHPEAAEILVRAIGKNNVCAYGNFSRIDENGEELDQGWEEPLYSRERLMRSMIVHHPRMFRRDAWRAVKGHDEKLRNAEDYDFFIKLSEIGDFVHVRKNLYLYRVLDGSASNFDANLLTENTYLVQRRMIERNNLDYRLVVVNPNLPRNIRYQHIAYSDSAPSN